MPTRNDPPQARRAPLTRDRVLDAGVALADAEGIGALSMRRLGRELGVEAMSLYNHVDGKTDLLDGMLDRVVGEIELPEGDTGWRDQARRRAISAHEALMRHPWAASLWTSSLNPGPRRMRYMDVALRSLRAADFTPGLLDRAFHTIEDHLVGHALQALGFPLDPDEMEEAGERVLRSFPVETYPDLAAHIRYHVESKDQGGGFEFGLDLILDGLERLRGSA
ncbi:TetR family transcriptional regulator [Nocardiopsis sp. Huas11]|uniref:TetR/AcrR family transcriptional regulator C-terminal domain-containing protein n=1 Tax=Nocardiopsis sp. Huas11 TaxID=2183912 RepID=UPI000F24F441|nr:TetR/AcrR family transcriptional regulator C-terminal domain-containing protein [Nocardiopsis sp. Huas11]RKS05128.1 TetR family transcriptional regulator [Nocardiopsis sp. Huas11]